MNSLIQPLDQINIINIKNLKKMDVKRFTVVDTRNNQTKTIESQATKVGELLDDLRKNGINPDGMAIQEGLSKTELPTDVNAYLPHDVPYKGGTTNNLVFRLTQREKRIKSGAMSRSEAFTKVKELGLAAHINEKYGRNFTQCKTSELVAEIEAATSKDAPEECICCETVGNIRDAVALLTQKLVDAGCIDDSEGEEVIGLLGMEVEEGCDYTAAEINALFKDM